MTARLRSAGAISGFVLLALGTTMTLQGQTGAPNGEWRTYGGDLASTRYSALDQINAQNFSKLEVAWRFRPDSLGPRLENNLQVTPLVANGKMYLTAGARRAAVALDAATGRDAVDAQPERRPASRSLAPSTVRPWSRLLDRWEGGTHPLCNDRLSTGGPRCQRRPSRGRVRPRWNHRSRSRTLTSRWTLLRAKWRWPPRP